MVADGWLRKEDVFVVYISFKAKLKTFLFSQFSPPANSFCYSHLCVCVVVVVVVVVCACVCACAHMYDVYTSVSYTFEFIVVFIRGGGGGGGAFPYGAFCGLFGWNCALHLYRISYLG